MRWLQVRSAYQQLLGYKYGALPNCHVLSKRSVASVAYGEGPQVQRPASGGGGREKKSKEKKIRRAIL